MRHGTGPNITTAAQVALRAARFQRSRHLPKVPKGLDGVELASPILVAPVGASTARRGADGGFGADGEVKVVRRAPKSLVRIQSYRVETDARSTHGQPRMGVVESDDNSDTDTSDEASIFSPRGARGIKRRVRSPRVITVGTDVYSQHDVKLPFTVPPMPTPRSIPTNRRKTPDTCDPLTLVCAASQLGSMLAAQMFLVVRCFGVPLRQWFERGPPGGFTDATPACVRPRDVPVDRRAECNRGRCRCWDDG